MNLHNVYGISLPSKGWVPSPTYLLRRNRILDALSCLPTGHLLEIGCGAGAMLYDLSNLGFIVEGFDMSPAAVEIARQINRDHKHTQIHQTIDNLGEKKFDYILAFEVLEHIDDDINALKTWNQWLKNNGRLILSVPLNPKKWTAADQWAGHYRRYNPQDLKAALEKAGFKNNRFEIYGFPLSNMIHPIRAIHYANVLKHQHYIDKTSSSKRSGIDRGLENKLYPIQSSWIGTNIMKLCFQLQKTFGKKGWGTGIISMSIK